MPEKNPCPACEADLIEDGSIEGLCPGCLLKLGLGDEQFTNEDAGSRDLATKQAANGNAPQRVRSLPIDEQ